MHAKAPEATAKYITKGCDSSKLTIPELATTLKGKDKGEKVAIFTFSPFEASAW